MCVGGGTIWNLMACEREIEAGVVEVGECD